MKKSNKFSLIFAFFGFLGIKHLNGDPLSLIWFAFFAEFSHIWWSKLGCYEDERLIANKHRAGTIALYTGLVIVFVSTFAIRLYTEDLFVIYKLQILTIA
ncbi:MAG: DUF3796 domain-containing protein, partial [Peptostreptococcaceae bacterium]